MGRIQRELVPARAGAGDLHAVGKYLVRGAAAVVEQRQARATPARLSSRAA